MLANTLAIAHVTQSFGGGVATYLRLVLPALVAKGHKVDLLLADELSREGRADVDAITQSGVGVKLLPMQREIRPISDCRAMILLHNALRVGEYNLVHTHCSKAGVLGRLAARQIGCPTVHTPHCYGFLRSRTSLTGQLIKCAERLVRSSTAALVAVCSPERGQAIRLGLIDARQCVVIPNGIPSVHIDPVAKQWMRKQIGLTAHSLVVTMVARLVNYKGCGLLLRAAKLCRGLDAIFILAGHGHLEHRVREYAIRHGLSNHVRMLGHISTVASLLSASDICVLCSRAEGQPYALLEAMRGGCPIVATAVPGNQDLLEHEKTGLLVPYNAHNLAQAIYTLATNEALRNRLVVEARDKYCRVHMLDRQISSLIELYVRVAKSGTLNSASCI